MHMSKKQYLKMLNNEIQKLNGVIDRKISQHHNYKREAIRHKKLLAEIRKHEVKVSVSTLINFLRPNWL